MYIDFLLGFFMHKPRANALGVYYTALYIKHIVNNLFTTVIHK